MYRFHSGEKPHGLNFHLRIVEEQQEICFHSKVNDND